MSSAPTGGRRHFLGLLGAAAGLGAVGLPGGLARATPTPAVAPRIAVAYPAGLADATALAQRIRDELGAGAELAPLPGDLLGVPAALAALLAGADRDGLVAVGDDATGVLVHALAAAQGFAIPLYGSHRTGPQGVRHRIVASRLGGALEWTDPPAHWTGDVARLYAALCAGSPLPEIRPAARPAGWSPGGLSSVLLVPRG